MDSSDPPEHAVHSSPFTRIVLWLMALGFLGFGLAFTVWPLPMGRVIDVVLPTPTARIDFAATYGGFEIGFGAFLIACARRPDWLRPGLWAAASALAGFALVRIMGMLVAGSPGRPIFIALALEITGTVLCLLALRAAGTRSGQAAPQ